jgi:hypothetical protein
MHRTLAEAAVRHGALKPMTLRCVGLWPKPPFDTVRGHKQRRGANTVATSFT